MVFSFLFLEMPSSSIVCHRVVNDDLFIPCSLSSLGCFPQLLYVVGEMLIVSCLLLIGMRCWGRRGIIRVMKENKSRRKKKVFILEIASALIIITHHATTHISFSIQSAA